MGFTHRAPHCFLDWWERLWGKGHGAPRFSPNSNHIKSSEEYSQVFDTQHNYHNYSKRMVLQEIVCFDQLRTSCLLRQLPPMWHLVCEYGPLFIVNMVHYSLLWPIHVRGTDCGGRHKQKNIPCLLFLMVQNDL